MGRKEGGEGVVSDGDGQWWSNFQKYPINILNLKNTSKYIFKKIQKNIIKNIYNRNFPLQYIILKTPQKLIQTEPQFSAIIPRIFSYFTDPKILVGPAHPYNQEQIQKKVVFLSTRTEVLYIYEFGCSQLKYFYYDTRNLLAILILNLPNTKDKGQYYQQFYSSVFLQNQLL